MINFNTFYIYFKIIILKISLHDKGTGLVFQRLMALGVNDKFGDMVTSFYCYSINICESQWKIEWLGIRQRCLMSPWLFNVSIDGVFRKMKKV